MRRAAACVGMFLVVITSTTIAEDQPQAGTLKTLDRPALERWLREAVTIASDDVVDTLIPLRTATLGKLAEAQSAIGDAEGAAITRELLPPAAVPKVPKRNPATAQVRTANKVEDQVRAYDQRISDRMQILGNDFQQKGENLSTVIQGTALAESLNKSGNRVAARRVLNLAMMLSEKDLNDSHNALLVARSEIAIGDVESARATLARTEQRLNETPKLNDRAVDLHDVIATYWILGDKEHARGIVQKTITAANFDLKKESDKQVEFLLPRLLATIEDYEAAFRLDAELYTGRYRYTLIESMTHRIPGSPANFREAYEDPLMSLAAVRQALAVAFRYVLTTQPADRPHPTSDQLSQLSLLGQLQSRAGDVASAQKSLEALKSRSTGQPPETIGTALGKVLIELAKAEWKTGSQPKAKAHLVDAIRLAEALPDIKTIMGRFTPDYPHDKSLSEIMIAQTELGQLDDVIATAARIHDPFQKAQALAGASRTRAFDGKDIPGALKLATAPGHGFPSIKWLSVLASEQSRLGNNESATAILRLALNEAEHYQAKCPTDPTIPPYMTMQNILQGHWYRPPEGRDRETLQRTQLASELTYLRAHLDDIPGARKALESIENPAIRDDHLLPVLRIQLSKGDIRDAFLTAMNIPAPRTCLETLSSLADEITSIVSNPTP